MMGKRSLCKRSLVVALAVVMGLALCVAPLLAEDGIVVKVGQNQSISFICFKEYGRYAPEMLDPIKALNRNIKNWQDLPSGAKLTLPPEDKMDQIAPPEGPETAVITYLDPPATVTRPEAKEAAPAQVNMVLGAGDQVQVGEGGRLEIMTTGPRLIRLSQFSNLAVSSLLTDPADKSLVARFRLFVGRLWGKVLMMRQKKGHNLYVGSPTAVVGIRGTAYDMDVAQDQSTTVRVYEGQVEVYNPMQKPEPGAPPKPYEKPHKVQGPSKVAGPHRVTQEEWEQIVLKQYQEVRITSEGITKPRDFDYWRERESDWVKWNEQRDQFLVMP